MAFDSEHNSAARGYELGGRVEKSFGHTLGVEDGAPRQYMWFEEGEWVVVVIDIRQAGVISLGGLRFDKWRRVVTALLRVHE